MSLEGIDRSTDFTSVSGGETVLTYDFPLYAEADLDAYLDGSLLVLGSAYTITGIGSPTGGDVTLTTALTVGQRVQLFRTTEALQVLDLEPAGPFPAQSVETALDRTNAAVQDALARAERGIAYPPASDSPTLVLPEPIAGAILGTDANDANTLVWIGLTQPQTFAASAQERVTASAGQTVFNLTNPYQPGVGQIHIYVNGVRQHNDAFNETSGTSITFTEGLELGDVVFSVRAGFNNIVGADAATTTFTQSGPGAVSTFVQNKLFEIPSVGDYGALGDGVNDDTAAFNTALVNHGQVFVSTGTYNLPGAVNVAFGSALVMAPAAVLIATGGITIAGEFLGTDAVHFNNTSVVSFSQDHSAIRPEWFGAVEAATLVNRTAALGRAIASLPNGGRFQLNVTFETTNAIAVVDQIQLPLQSNDIIEVTMKAVGCQSGFTNRAWYSKRAFSHEDGAGLAVIDAQQDVYGDVESDATWGGVSFVVSGDQLRISVTGKAATTIAWRVSIDFRKHQQ